MALRLHGGSSESAQKRGRTTPREGAHEAVRVPARTLCEPGARAVGDGAPIGFTRIDPVTDAGSGTQPDSCPGADRSATATPPGPSPADVLDYIATMTAELRRLAARSGQRRIGAALRIAEQETRLEFIRLASQQAQMPGDGG